jgi:hypothetical protein
MTNDKRCGERAFVRSRRRQEAGTLLPFIARRGISRPLPSAVTGYFTRQFEARQMRCDKEVSPPEN